MALVYSDLMSRRSAMGGFARAHTVTAEDGDLLDQLGNGHAAAERFAGDLASARSAAAAVPSFTPASPGSRAAAETLLLVDYVNGANAGCDSRGGFVVTQLPPITWRSDGGGDHR